MGFTLSNKIDCKNKNNNVGFLNNTNRMDGGFMDHLWTRFQREKEVERERDGA